MDTLLGGGQALETPLLSLASKGWIEHNTDDRAFKCSPVVQEIAKNKNTRLFEDCRPLIAALTDKLDYEGGAGHLINTGYKEAALFARYGQGLLPCFPAATEEIAVLCERMGNYHQTTGDLNHALRFFEDYSELGKALHEAHPDNVAFKNGLAVSYAKLGTTQIALGKVDKGKSHYLAAKSLWEDLTAHAPHYVAFKRNLAWVNRKLSEL